jgi:hypothetical protein
MVLLFQNRGIRLYFARYGGNQTSEKKASIWGLRGLGNISIIDRQESRRCFFVVGYSFGKL